MLELASTACGLATATIRMEFCTALAAVAERQLIDFNAQELANTACASATAIYWSEKLFAALARAVEQRPGDCKI